jgi:hypothetical protein
MLEQLQMTVLYLDILRIGKTRRFEGLFYIRTASNNGVAARPSPHKPVTLRTRPIWGLSMYIASPRETLTALYNRIWMHTWM